MGGNEHQESQVYECCEPERPGQHSEPKPLEPLVSRLELSKERSQDLPWETQLAAGSGAGLQIYFVNPL